MKSRNPWLVASATWLTACGGSNFNGAAKSVPANPQGAGNAAGTNGANAGTDGSAAPDAGKNDTGDGAGGKPGSDLGAAGAPPNINFGLLVNDFNCTFCHIEVHGTVISLGDAAPLRKDSNGKVFGKWLVAGVYHATNALSQPPRLGGIAVSGGVTSHYDNAGKEMPVDASGKPAFPAVDFTQIGAKAVGKLTTTAAAYSVPAINKVYSGNAILVGTADKPITIDNDVLINGDLVIKGVYTGIGTIYVTGNIYIPANLRALHLASFPYSDDVAQANGQAIADLKGGGKDGLGLAAAKNIFIGDLENYTDNGEGQSSSPAGAHGPRWGSIYTPSTVGNSAFNSTVNGVWNVYKWLPELQFEQLYEESTPCWTKSSRPLIDGHHWGERTWTQIDAYLYSANTIAGVNRAQSWTLNGGMIAQAMHIVSGADYDRIQANGQCPPARINFDFRLQNGLQILERLAGQFPTK